MLHTGHSSATGEAFEFMGRTYSSVTTVFVVIIRKGKIMLWLLLFARV